jgi:hypothetical protein
MLVVGNLGTLAFHITYVRSIGALVDCYIDACYHSVQRLLSSRLLSSNVKVKNIQNHNSASCFVWV